MHIQVRPPLSMEPGHVPRVAGPWDRQWCRQREQEAEVDFANVNRQAQLVGMVGAHKQGKSPRAREEMKRASCGLVQVDPSRSVGLHKMKTRQRDRKF